MDQSLCSDSVAQASPELASQPRFSVEPPKIKTVFIGLPIYHAVDPHFFLSTLKLVESLNTAKFPFNGILQPLVGDSAIGRARNSLTRLFLESDATHLLFIDSDLIYSAEQIARIMSHDEDVVGGLYQKKQEGDPQLVINSLNNPEEKDNGLMTVRYVGTGFLRIARSVFERMIDRWPEMAYKLDPDHKKTEHDFWHMGVYDYAGNGHGNDWPSRYLSEDWWFCQRCWDLGIKVWADRRICLKHSGTAIYPLSYQEKQLVKYDPLPEKA